MIAYGLKKGDEVIVPSFTFIATANAPLFVGARPVFAEIEEQSYGLDPEDVLGKDHSSYESHNPHTLWWLSMPNKGAEGDR